MLYEKPDMSRTRGFRIFAVKMKKGLQKSQIYFLSAGEYRLTLSWELFLPFL